MQTVILLAVLVALVAAAFLIAPFESDLAIGWVVLVAVVASLSQTLVRSLTSWIVRARRDRIRWPEPQADGTQPPAVQRELMSSGNAVSQ